MKNGIQIELVPSIAVASVPPKTVHPTHQKESLYIPRGQSMSLDLMVVVSRTLGECIRTLIEGKLELSASDSHPDAEQFIADVGGGVQCMK